MSAWLGYKYDCPTQAVNHAVNLYKTMREPIHIVSPRGKPYLRVLSETAMLLNTKSGGKYRVLETIKEF
jgi:hypothetical protein